MIKVKALLWQVASLRDLYGFHLRQLRTDRRGGWIENIAWLALILGGSIATVSALGGSLKTIMDKIAAAMATIAAT